MFDIGWAAVAEEPRRSAAPCWSRWVPGSELASALEGSGPVDLVDDEGYDAAERLAGWEAIVNWATGRLHRETAHYLQAREARARGAGRGELASEAVAMEVATLARISPRSGEIRIHQASTLVDQLPCTLAALEEGRISLGHARAVLDQVELCDPGTARAVDAELWARPARDRTPAQLRDVVRRIVARLDPDMVRRRPEQARKTRELRYWSEDHGATGVIQLRLPGDEARGVYSIIDALARAAGDAPDGEQRTLAQKRADSARDLVLDGATAGGGDSCCCGASAGAGACASGGRAGAGTAGDGLAGDDAAGEGTAGDGAAGDRAAGDDAAGDGATDDGATTRAADECRDADAEDARGTEDAHDTEGDPAADVAEERGASRRDAEDARDPVRGLRAGRRSPVRAEVRVTIGWDVLAGFSDRPAELEGHGPIPAAMARRLASGPDAWWRRLLTDPVTGTAAHLDARRYRPPASMQDFVRARDVTCAAPGCRVPAARCDLDHVARYEHDKPAGGGGPTRGDTLKPACRRHHRIKTHGGWSATLGPDPEGGSAPVITWTSPSGRRWWVRSPALDPPSWERDGAPDDARHDQREDPGGAAADEVGGWPSLVDSWRRRGAVRPGNPGRRAG